jgi:secondary thiamine-phosphate synthase enzyme
MMKVIAEEISVSTQGNADVIDITADVKKALGSCGMLEGVVTLFVRGSTAGLSTIEYEPNLVKDLKDALQRLVPSDIGYAHTKTWGDYNGHSHIRATLMGPSLEIPFTRGKMPLGTWQQIILVDFDTSPRQRRIQLQFIGK